MCVESVPCVEDDDNDVGSSKLGSCCPRRMLGAKLCYDAQDSSVNESTPYQVKSLATKSQPDRRGSMVTREKQSKGISRCLYDERVLRKRSERSRERLEGVFRR